MFITLPPKFEVQHTDGAIFQACHVDLIVQCLNEILEDSNHSNIVINLSYLIHHLENSECGEKFDEDEDEDDEGYVF